MDKAITIYIDGNPVPVKAGTVLAVALAQAGIAHFCRSPEGHPRAPLCGMGTCFECKVTLDGIPHQRSCQTQCRDGMCVETANA